MSDYEFFCWAHDHKTPISEVECSARFQLGQRDERIERLSAEHKAAELLWWDEKGALEDQISELQAEVKRLKEGSGISRKAIEAFTGVSHKALEEREQ